MQVLGGGPYTDDLSPTIAETAPSTSTESEAVPSGRSTTLDTGNTDYGADDYWDIVAGRSTSCDFATAVADAYSVSDDLESGSGFVTATDPEDGQSHRMYCAAVSNESVTNVMETITMCTGGQPLRTVHLGEYHQQPCSGRSVSTKDAKPAPPGRRLSKPVA